FVTGKLLGEVNATLIALVPKSLTPQKASDFRPIDVAVDPKDSWGWKCILNLRELVGSHMRYKIGDGKCIKAWHDKWNSGISLSSIISKKYILYASFHDQDNIADVMDENGWKWPQSWLVEFSWLNNVKVLNLKNCHDMPIWVDND
ncbi:hypothetical protein Tco_1062557, partial [Tanacetum coccineum]